MTEPRTAIVAGLYELAAALDADPAIPLPHHTTRPILVFAHTAAETAAVGRLIESYPDKARQVLLPFDMGLDGATKVDIDVVGLTVRCYLPNAHVDPEFLRLLPVEDRRPSTAWPDDPDVDAIAGLEAALAGTTTTGSVEADEDDPDLLRTVEAPFSLDAALGDVSGDEEELDDHDLDELAIMVRAKIGAGTFSDQELVELGLGTINDEGDLILNRAGLAVAKRLLPIELRRDLDGGE